MNKKKLISWLLTASMLMPLGMFSVASAADHTEGEHDFGDPFTPYLNTKLVFKDQIEAEKTIEHTSKNVSGSPAVKANIIESSAQFYTRDNGDGTLTDGSLTDRTYGNVKNIMFAYMYEPEAEGKYPAILFLHGGGGTADTLKERAKDFAAKGYVTMAIDIPALTGTVGNVTVGGETVARSSGAYIGNDNYRFNITEAEGGAKNSNLVDAEVGVIQAFNYLASNAKVDTTKMGIMGSSWGGYSTTFVAGILGDKVKAAYSQYGSGFYGPAPDGIKYESFWTDNGYYPTDEFAIKEWYRYLDPSSHLDNLKANYYMDAAAKDTFFRPKSVEANLDKALSGKNAASVNHVWSYNASHESISGSDSIYPFMDYYLKGESDLTAPSTTEITKTVLKQDGSNEVHIKVTSAAVPSSVELVYSKNNAAYTAREWKTMKAAAGENGEYTAVIPADVVADGVEYYALTRDSDKAMYSSSRMKTGFTQKVSVAATPSFTLDDSKVYALGKGEFTAKVPVVNNDDAENSDVRVILALYKNGALETTDISETTTLAAGESKDISVSANIADEDVTPYTAKILIWDSVDGMKPYSRTYNLASTDSAPTAPANLKAVSSTIDGIELAWDASEDNIAVEGYNVYRRTDGAYEKIATLSGNSLSYTDTMIEVNETYNYAVEAIDGSGNNSNKAEVSANSIEGAKVVFEAFDSGSSTTITGEKLQAVMNTTDGVTIVAHKPLQDEQTLNALSIADGQGKYIQLKVDDEYINAELDNKVAVMVTFDDVNFDNLRMQYNSSDGNNYKPAVIYKKVNEQRWRTQTYIIKDAAFANKAGAGIDLRLNFDAGWANYIRMIQIVNLSEDFAQISAGADSIKLAWKTVKNASAYSIYRDGELIDTVDAPARTYEDTGLTIDTSYEYTLKASVVGTEPTIGTITASTLKKVAAEVDFTNDESSNMTATTTGFNEETVDGIKALTTDSSSQTLKLSVNNTAVTGKGHRLLTIKYNDCGIANTPIRISMVNTAIDRAHYFYTSGSGKWETATVLIPDASFNNNIEDIQIKSTANSKYAIADVKLSDCPSYDVGAYYVNGIVSGITTDEDGLLNSSLTSFIMANDKTNAAVDEYNGEKVIRIDSTDVNANGEKRADIKLVPDYRFLGQTYSGAVLPGADGYDEKPATVRPVTVKVTYLKNNSKGMIYVKGAKYDSENNRVVNNDNDASLPLTGTGEWATAKINIDDYFVQGNSSANTSPIELVFSGVPENEDIIIGKIEITHRDYSTKVGEYSFADTDSAEALTASLDAGVEVEPYQNKTAAVINGSGKNVQFAVDKNVVVGRKDRLLTITYHDGGTAGIPVRVSMVNNTIDGAHYFYTRGTNRWETTTVLIPAAQFSNNANDIIIKLIRDGQSIAISKVELYDGSEHTDRTEDTGATGATGIASGIVNYNGMFNSSLATWDVDEYTTLSPVTVGEVQAVKITSSNEDKNYRAEFKIVPDYRYLGLTQKSGDLPEGTTTPVTVRVTYYKGDGLMYVKGAKLSGSALAWPDNDGVVTFSSTSDNESNKVKVTNVDGNWITAEVDIDNYFMNGGSDIFRSYIQFVTNNATDGTIIKSIEIINKTTD